MHNLSPCQADRQTQMALHVTRITGHGPLFTMVKVATRMSISGDICWWCRGKLIWGGDEDIEDGDFDMATNLTCSDCGAQVVYYRPIDEENPND